MQNFNLILNIKNNNQPTSVYFYGSFISTLRGLCGNLSQRTPRMLIVQLTVCVLDICFYFMFV